MKSYLFQVQSPKGTGYAEVLYEPYEGFHCRRTTPDLVYLQGPVEPHRLRDLIFRVNPRASVDWIHASIPTTDNFYRSAQKIFRKGFKTKKFTNRAVRGAGWDAYSGRHGVGAFK
jgi:hypothetical protein